MFAEANVDRLNLCVARERPLEAAMCVGSLFACQRRAMLSGGQAHLHGNLIGHLAKNLASQYFLMKQ